MGHGWQCRPSPTEVLICFVRLLGSELVWVLIIVGILVIILEVVVFVAQDSMRLFVAITRFDAIRAFGT